MRTALIAWDYPPSPSGLSTAAREIAESLVAAGVDTTVFTLDRTGRSGGEGPAVIGCGIAPGGSLARLRRFAGAGHLAAPAAFRRAVLAEHARRPFDVVEATNWYAPGLLLAGRRGLPLVTRNSTPAAFSREDAPSLRNRFDGAVADRLERRQARGSAGLISNTAEHARRVGAEYALEEGGRPHAVIGLSLPPATLARGAAAPYREPEASEPVRLLFVGRAEHRKGFDTIAQAAAILGAEADRGEIPAFEIVLVGVPEGDLPADLASAARARMRALGRLPEGELATRYAEAHAVLAPSRYESFGLVYQEGLAYGRPMIASLEDASAREFVGDTGAGRMARRNTGPDLADAMRPVIADPATRAQLRAKALLAAGRFTRATLAEETLALYQLAVAQAARH